MTITLTPGRIQENAIELLSGDIFYTDSPGTIYHVSHWNLVRRCIVWFQNWQSAGQVERNVHNVVVATLTSMCRQMGNDVELSNRRFHVSEPEENRMQEEDAPYLGVGHLITYGEFAGRIAVNPAFREVARVRGAAADTITQWNTCYDALRNSQLTAEGQLTGTAQNLYTQGVVRHYRGLITLPSQTPHQQAGVVADWLIFHKVSRFEEADASSLPQEYSQVGEYNSGPPGGPHGNFYHIAPLI